MTEQLAHDLPKPADLAQNPRISFEADDRHRVEQIPVGHWYAGPKRPPIRLVPTGVTGRRISRRHDPVLHGLPSVEEWTGRDVWIPPAPARLRTRV